MSRPPFVPVNAVRTQPLEVQLDSAQRCPYCRGGVEPEQELVACNDCQTVFHADCAKNGCTTYGCAPAGRIRFAPRASRRRWPRVHWRRVAGALSLLVSGAVLFAWGQDVWRPQPGPELAGPVVSIPVVAPPFEQDYPLPCVIETEIATPLHIYDLPSKAWVEVRGDVAFVHGQAGQPGRVTIEGSDGQSLSWDHTRAGPFEGTVTLSGPGLHTLMVRFVGQDGSEFTHVAQVQR